MLFIIWFTEFQKDLFQRAYTIKIGKPRLEKAFLEMIANSNDLEDELWELKDFVVAEELHKRSDSSFAKALDYNQYLVLKNKKNISKVY